MTAKNWKEGRSRLNWTQVEAAKRLGVSQSYLSQLENGTRMAPEELSRQGAELYNLVTALPLADLDPIDPSPDELQTELAGLEYPPFSHVHTSLKVNPAKVVFDVLGKPDLDTRLVEALPWVLRTYPDLDWQWLLNKVKLRNAQNRLGYVVYLAKQVASRPDVLETLNSWESDLEEARLAKEGTLCRDSMSEAERKWLKEHRPPAAEHWSLLTSLTPDQLSYA